MADNKVASVSIFVNSIAKNNYWSSLPQDQFTPDNSEVYSITGGLPAKTDK